MSILKKIILGAGILSILNPLALADAGDMMGFGSGYGMMGGTLGMGLFGIIYFLIAVFIFSLIFWWTYTLIVKKKK